MAPLALRDHLGPAGGAGAGARGGSAPFPQGRLVPGIPRLPLRSRVPARRLQASERFLRPPFPPLHPPLHLLSPWAEGGVRFPFPRGACGLEAPARLPGSRELRTPPEVPSPEQGLRVSGRGGERVAALALRARGRGGEPARRRDGKPPGVWRAPQETRPLGAESHCLQPGLPVALGLCRKRRIGG